MTIPQALQSVGQPITEEQRTAFERDGHLVIRGALDAAEIAHYTELLDQVYDRHARSGDLAADGSLHLLGAVARCPSLTPLIDHPSAFGLVWSILGWNVHLYHSHLDVHPRVRGPKPYRFEWHQDGGRQNRELETDPRPRLSVKVAYWLSDVSVPGRGNLKVVPGSHLTNRIDGPPRRDLPWPEPTGAVEVTAGAGDAVFFDRRIWHARSTNHSPITRKAVFFGYTYRWVRIRDEIPSGITGISALQQQLLGSLGAPDGDHAWGHYPDDVPLYAALRDAGLLDPASPPLRP